MSRRFRRSEQFDEADVPYGPSEPAEAAEGAAAMSDAAAVVLFLAVTMYAIFGGADFGAGFWDLIAGGTKRGERPREVIDHSIAPVWEANHVWLIFVFVVLWTCFPEAYASITLTLFVPLTLAAFGIVLRGASLRLPQVGVPHRDRRNFGAAFAVSSVLVPYFLGTVVGAIASGRVAVRRQGGRPRGQLGQPDVHPRRRPRGRAWRRTWPRSSWSATRPALGRGDGGRTSATGRPRPAWPPVSSSLVGIFVLSNDADYLFDGLTSRALPLVDPVRASAASARSCCSPGAIRRGARAAAVVAVGSVVVAWGVAQWDYLLPTSLTVSEAAAPSGTITAMLVATGLAVLLLGPSFVPALRARPEDTAARGGRARAGIRESEKVRTPEGS